MDEFGYFNDFYPEDMPDFDPAAFKVLLTKTLESSAIARRYSEDQRRILVERFLFGYENEMQMQGLSEKKAVEVFQRALDSLEDYQRLNDPTPQNMHQ